MTSRKPISIGRKALIAALAGLLAPLTLSGAAQSATTPRLKPPAPAPAYISVADKERLLSVAKSLKAKDFNTARSLNALVSDPIASSLGDWMYFMAQDPAIDFNEADAFLDANPDWPARSRISKFIENKIPSGAGCQ